MKVKIIIEADTYEQAVMALKDTLDFANDFENEIRSDEINYIILTDDFEMDFAWTPHS